MKTATLLRTFRIPALGFGLFSLVVLSGCMTLNKPVLGPPPSGTSGGGGSDASSGGSSCATTINVNVTAQYPAFGSNWLDYVDAGDPVNAACNPATNSGAYESCIHGGERRKVVLTGVTSCTGLTFADNLGVFEWRCNDTLEANAYLYSVALKKTKGLKDLIETNPSLGFKSNYVTVTDASNCVVAQSTPSTTWWTNTITALSDPDVTDEAAVELNTSGTVYVLQNSAQTDGFNINADKIAVVVLDGATLRYSGAYNTVMNNNGNCQFNAEIHTASAMSCLISIGNQSFIWIEGTFSGVPSGSAYGAPSNAQYGFYIGNECTYFHVRDVRVINGSGNIYGFVASNYSGTYGLNNSFIYKLRSEGGVDMIKLSYSSYNYFDRIYAAGGSGIGLELTHATGNRVINVKSYSNGGKGIVLNAAPGQSYNDSTMVNVLSANNNSAGDEDILLGAAEKLTLHLLSGGNRDSTNNTNALISSRWDTKNTHTLSQILGVNTWAVIDTDRSNTQVNTIAGSHVNFLIRFEEHDPWDAGTPNETTNITLGGNVWVGNTLGGTPCSVGGLLSNPAETNLNTTCSYGAGPTAPLSSVLDLLTVLTGPTTDSANAHGAAGSALVGAITDWFQFDRFNRFWGASDGAAALSNAVGDQFQCTGTCQIYDFTPASASTLSGVNGTYPAAGGACPSGVDASVAANIVTDGLTTPNTYLLHAFELTGDYDSDGARIGDDDGLCESNEACVFVPDIGSTNFLTADTSTPLCTFTGGNGVVNVTLFKGAIDAP